nr:hypothetical protein [Parachlamydiaceae bacterium]
PDQFDQIYQIIEGQLPNDEKNFFEIRKQVWEYTFGNERSFNDIRADIIQQIESK